MSTKDIDKKLQDIFLHQREFCCGAESVEQIMFLFAGVYHAVPPQKTSISDYINCVHWPVHCYWTTGANLS